MAAEPRVRLMLALGAQAGLRRGEIARVAGTDLEGRPGAYGLRVTGKGGKVRVVPISDELADRIAQHGAGYVFPGQDEGHLSPAYVGKLIGKVLGPGWTTHTLRHRFASEAYLAERDLLAVRDLLGHANVSTTQVYTAVPNDAARRAALTAAQSSNVFGGDVFGAVS